MKNTQGQWTRASIQRDRARFAELHPEPFAGDPFPVGKTPEQLGGSVVPGDWDSYEPNTNGGG